MNVRVLDDREREFVFTAPPRRIVSLVPSETLNLFALGAGDRLVGRTSYCVLPEERVASLPTVGGTKDVEVAKVLALAPELVLANQEENARASLTALVQAGLRVFVSFPQTVRGGFAHLARLAKLLGVAQEAEARALLSKGLRALEAAETKLREEAAANLAPIATFAPVWQAPLMTGSAETFLSDLLALAGARNVFADRKRRYPLAADLGRAPELPPEQLGARDTRWPRVTEEELIARRPELVLLGDEPYAFGAADVAHFRSLDLPAARSGRVLLVSGRDLTWHGAHAIDALPRLRALVDQVRLRRE